MKHKSVNILYLVFDKFGIIFQSLFFICNFPAKILAYFLWVFTHTS